MKPIYFLVLFFCFFRVISTSFSQNGNILLVPEEYPSIQAAIDLSVEKSVISIAPGEYFERVRIYEKSITLIGRDSNTPSMIKAAEILGPSAENDTPIIHINNSTVRIENLCVSSFIVSKTVLVEKADVEFVKCEITGSETQSAFGHTLNPSQPALYLLGGEQNQIHVHDSVIRGGDNSEKETLGGTAIMINSCTETVLHFKNSTVIGGHGTSDSEAGRSSTNPGGPALHIQDSNQLSIQAESTIFQGGQGAGSIEMRGHGSTGAGYTFSGKDGGNAFIADNSSVSITDGQFIGGNGGDGFRYYSDFAEKWVIGEPGLGGCGIQILNDSVVELENARITGGKAGATNDSAAEAVCVEASSIYRHTVSTIIREWSAY